MEEKELVENNLEVKNMEQINPATDKGVYLVQIIDNNESIKEILAVNATVRVINIGEQGVAAILN